MTTLSDRQYLEEPSEQDHFVEWPSLDLRMDNDSRFMSVSHEGPSVFIAFDDAGDEDRNDYQAYIELSEQEAWALHYCLLRLLEWNQEFEDECAALAAKRDWAENS